MRRIGRPLKTFLKLRGKTFWRHDWKKCKSSKTPKRLMLCSRPLMVGMMRTRTTQGLGRDVSYPVNIKTTVLIDSQASTLV
ncbi:hypothetical protein I307_03819 [Cryptococcus deuterogattii 99/473]|uniref:Unplaced genomic scaffold supercont1.18, whole genome shotgun sequence n=1 Tax=Cryptococcus deuterogattii Ram5 TaxID=1296110 RepID=A0A0D0UYQ1_9TREE|nr:hypothetical protein I313_06201 [Cryptococcus deuterogattii Ram5]KIR70162.1 hypothetical protein I310_06150 [Cryptococcus deuterogattii CA1014]KIY56715.1 hypothetical protein I307_03819 [Cryptococcus deuterogattii 99/473]